MDIEKINKLSVPLILGTILIVSLILGGFYYASQARKRESIERQQAAEFRQKQTTAFERELCHSEAVSDAVSSLKRYCDSWSPAYPGDDFYKTFCGEGMYIRDVYESNLNNCLLRKGLK